jgi:hypothetical protein
MNTNGSLLENPAARVNTRGQGFSISAADDVDREQIYRIRHEVYADELGFPFDDGVFEIRLLTVLNQRAHGEHHRGGASRWALSGEYLSFRQANRRVPQNNRVRRKLSVSA